MKIPILILIFAVVSASFSKPVDNSTEALIESAVTACCSVHHINCCRHAVKLNEQIDCSKKPQEHEAENLRIIDCLSSRLHPESVETNNNYLQNALPCCAVFSSQHDPQNKCRQICIQAIHTPSLSESEKMTLIASCRFRNPLFDVSLNLNIYNLYILVLPTLHKTSDQRRSLQSSKLRSYI
jgi:hypothetical protein